MASTVGSRSANGDVRVNGHSPWVWALRRAAMGVMILAVTIGVAAWLLYAAIDPDMDASSDARAAPTTIITGAPPSPRALVAQ